jgi:hypothetical protein
VIAFASNPMLGKSAVAAHLVLAAYLLVNGFAHQAAVLWKWRAGTLAAGADLSALLAVGAGLLVAGAAASWSVAPLLRDSAAASIVPAVASVAVLAVVLALTAAAYGFTFLRGSIFLGVVDLALLVAHRVANSASAWW